MRSPLFQFTHPGKGATASKSAVDVLLPVSIHAPWEGCDLALVEVSDGLLEFQFTHPGKGATAIALQELSKEKVSIHAPWEGCDTSANTSSSVRSVSIHAPWEGCDRCPYSRCPRTSCFNSRTLGRVRLYALPSRHIRSAFQFTHPGKGATYPI